MRVGVEGVRAADEAVGRAGDSYECQDGKGVGE